MKTIIGTDEISIILTDSEATSYDTSPTYQARINGHALEMGVTCPSRPIRIAHEWGDVLHSIEPIGDGEA